MFLMNAPPVVTLQSKWEAFGPPGSFRFPGCFSESKEDVTRASVNAKVQMIISTLQQHDEVPLGMNDERPVQRSQKAERCRDARLATSPSTCKEQPPAFAACGFAARYDPPGEEAAADLGPLVLDSDSDDSVDRDIEEAIQEYLKARSGAVQPRSGGTQPGRVSTGSSRCKLEPPHSSTPPILGPPKLAPVSGSVSGSSVGAGEEQGSASPVSVSSEDSFEQSIRAEIEQFLHKKRQHENPKCDASLDKNPDPNENAAKATLKSNKDPPIKVAPRQDLRGTTKEFVFRKPPRLARMSSQPRSLRPKVIPEPETTGSARPAVPKPEAAQSKGGVRRSAGAGRRGRQSRSPALVHEASDSSSDDGIEEAIQLYQLEKTRKEASGDPMLRTQLREETAPDPPAGSTSSSMKNALPETHRRAPSKKKPVALKAADPGPGILDLDSSKLLKDARASAPPGNTIARSECVERVSCRADTSAELICAEAILDISKTILPAPVASSDRPPSVSPRLHSPDVPSHVDGDSSSVDSDDSIEQEIRTFLALKAQSGSVLARAEGCPQPTQEPLLMPGPNSQASDPKAPPSNKTSDLSPSGKRKRSGGSNGVRPSTPKKTREVREGVQDGEHRQSRAQPSQDMQDPPSQGEASEVPGRESETRAQPVPPGTVGVGDMPLSQGPRGAGKAEEGQSVGEKESSEDKSSSLDSDADLDTAIKDLLQSKRKLKKRGRDPRAACKKKVRFSTTETRFVDRLGGLPRHWKDRGPRVLRSCLSKSSRDSRAGPGRRLPGIFSSAAEIIKPATLGDEDATPAFSQRSGLEGPLFSRELGARDACSARSASSLSEDSSVDSDDSIELEIQKFLAEKAKESVSISKIQGAAPTALGTECPARPEVLCRKELAPALQRGVCTRSQRARGGPQPVEGPRAAERAGVQGTASLFVLGGKGTPHTDSTPRVPATVGRCEPALPKSTSGTISAKGSLASPRNVYAHKDQSPRGAEPATVESVFGQLPSCARVAAEAGSTGGTFPMNYGSQSLLTPSPGLQVDLSLPWNDPAHQSRVPSPWALNSDGRGLAWTGGLGAERERAAEAQARGPPSLSDPRKGPTFPGFSSLLSTQLFHFGKSVPWGGTQAGLFSAPLGLPLQGPSFSAFRETPAGHGPMFGSPHLLTKKDDGHWPNRKAQAGLGLHNRKNSGSEENILDLRYPHRVMDRDNQDQEALGSDASEFSDTSVEDSGGSSVVKGKVLKL